MPDSEVEFQEQLIQEREGEIAEIEQGITELNQIFRDLATIVTDQGSMISESAYLQRTQPPALTRDVQTDNIESNVISVANDTRGASEQLVTAHNYQRKAASRMLCLLVIFIIVLAVVLLAVSCDLFLNPTIIIMLTYSLLFQDSVLISLAVEDTVSGCASFLSVVISFLLLRSTNCFWRRS